MGKLIVSDANLASKIYSVAEVGFRGTSADLAVKLDMKPINPTMLSGLASAVTSLIEVMRQCNVNIEFKRSGNNRYISIERIKGYKKAAPQFIPEAKVEEVLPAAPDEVRNLRADKLFLENELRAARAELRASSRDHGLYQAIVADLEPRIVPFTPIDNLQPAGMSDRENRETLVIHLSDGHHDQTVRPHECGGRETYNFWISCRRAETLVDSIIRWTHTTLNNFYFPNVVVLAYGDHTSGEIHSAVERSIFKNQFRNSLAIGQLHARMYRDLAAHFDNISVLYVPGNHGRRSIKKDHHGAKNNWDYLVAESARMYCRDIGNLSFVIPDAFSAIVAIEGHGFFVQHGDDIKSAGGVPWYGLERHTLRLLASNRFEEIPIDHYVCGHFHQPATVGPVGRRQIINGPWLGTDAYSYNTFGGYTEPEQLIHGVNEKRGMTWRLPIWLRTEGEQEGPQRYKIELSNEEGLIQEYRG
jgi:hypothetical protein